MEGANTLCGGGGLEPLLLLLPINNKFGEERERGEGLRVGFEVNQNYGFPKSENQRKRGDLSCIGVRVKTSGLTQIIYFFYFKILLDRSKIDLLL